MKVSRFGEVGVQRMYAFELVTRNEGRRLYKSVS